MGRDFEFWQNPLIYDSVRLIAQHLELELTGSTSSLDSARADISTYQPEIKLVEHRDNRTPSDIMQILEYGLWGARIIGLNLSNNQLSLYHREKWTLAKNKD